MKIPREMATRPLVVPTPDEINEAAYLVKQLRSFVAEDIAAACTIVATQLEGWARGQQRRIDNRLEDVAASGSGQSRRI